jgi:nucleotide-binding universal stress UspA family protein
MKHILLPFDFTETAENALVYAISLFEDSEITFHLLHVYEAKQSQLLSQERGNNWFDQMDDQAEVKLKDHVRELNETTSDNHTFKGIVKSDSIVKAIETVLSGTEIDLIISGTRGARGKSDVFLTTRTLSMIHRIRQCPILVVPFDYEYSPVQKVVFSTNFKKLISPKEIKPIVDIATLHDAHIEVVNLSEEQYLTTLQKENKQNIETLLSSFDHSFQKLEWSDSEAHTLTTYLKSSNSQLLCFVNHKYNFFYKLLQEDVIKKASFYSEVPVLIVQ